MRDRKGMSPSQETLLSPSPSRGSVPHLTHWLPDLEGGWAAWNQSDMEGSLPTWARASSPRHVLEAS